MLGGKRGQRMRVIASGTSPYQGTAPPRGRCLMLCHLPRVRTVRSSMIEYGFAILLLALVLVLAACGQVTTAGLGSPSSTATSTALAQNGTPAANGCPAKQVPADGATFSPDVTVTQDATSPQPIALSRGQ